MGWKYIYVSASCPIFISILNLYIGQSATENGQKLFREGGKVGGVVGDTFI